MRFLNKSFLFIVVGLFLCFICTDVFSKTKDSFEKDRSIAHFRFEFEPSEGSKLKYGEKIAVKRQLLTNVKIRLKIFYAKRKDFHLIIWPMKVVVKTAEERAKERGCKLPLTVRYLKDDAPVLRSGQEIDREESLIWAYTGQTEEGLEDEFNAAINIKDDMLKIGGFRCIVQGTGWDGSFEKFGDFIRDEVLNRLSIIDTRDEKLALLRKQ